MNLKEKIRNDFPKNINPGSIILTSKFDKLTHYCIPGYYSHGTIFIGNGLKNKLINFFKHDESQKLFLTNAKYRNIGIKRFINQFNNHEDYLLMLDLSNSSFITLTEFKKKYDSYMILEFGRFEESFKNYMIMQLVANFSLITIFKKYQINLSKDPSLTRSYCFKHIYDIYEIVLKKIGSKLNIEFENFDFGLFNLGNFLFAKNLILCDDFTIQDIILLPLEQ